MNQQIMTLTSQLCSVSKTTSFFNIFGLLTLRKYFIFIKLAPFRKPKIDLLKRVCQWNFSQVSTVIELWLHTQVLNHTNMAYEALTFTVDARWKASHQKILKVEIIALFGYTSLLISVLFLFIIAWSCQYRLFLKNSKTFLKL